MTLGYVLRRLGVFLVIVWAAATINFVVPRLAPGDPVQAMLGTMEAQGAKVEDSARLIQEYRRRFGLDEPLPVQYVKYLGAMARLDMGYSLSLFPARVTDIIRGGLPYTIALLTTTTLLSFAIGVVVGALMVWRATPRALRMGLPLVMVLAPIPYYLLAMVLLFTFAFALQWFPFTGIVSTGRVSAPGFDPGYFLDMVHHSVLPALSIILVSVGGWALGMRGMMVTVQGEDYLTLAEAKGLPQRRVFARYGLRNAMLPQFTHLAISLGHVVAGAALVEVIFGYPGVGMRLFQAISRADYTVIQGITFILVLSVALAILIIDLLYPRLDPRITYSRR
jgi:peptide/nickel transport system permease protein